MTQTPVVPHGASERRIRLTHHLLELEDGHEVGVSVSGAGVPLVFMHGLAAGGARARCMVLELAGEAVDEVGVEERESVELELVRQAERPQHTKRMPLLCRTYRRWTASHSGRGRSNVRWVRPDAQAV